MFQQNHAALSPLMCSGSTVRCESWPIQMDREEYRLGVGNWRVFFTADLNIIYIEEVKKRNETTY